jgi:preprotein translocase subunit SecA
MELLDMALLEKIFGSNERVVNKIRPIVEKVGSYEEEYKALSDDAIKNKTEEFKKRIKDGATTNQILPEAFALVREVAGRVINERHYDVQILGGAVLHQGKIAEMKTGEGKTLTSTLPIYLNALTGKGVHVVTVNDYLAMRDANWMGRVYEALGLTTACIVGQGVSYQYSTNVADTDEVSIEAENLIPISRRNAYACDITYGTNNEFGFDYLRDNMVSSEQDMVQRDLHFAIVDEVDSILIDEARTPLIISAPDSESGKLYERFAKIVPKLQAEKHYTIDEKMKVVTLTDEGITEVERTLGMSNMYATGNVEYVHHLEQSLKAEIIFKLDRDYVVKDGQVIIVDDFTGRLMPGRRYSEGLHQAIEAKEGVTVQRETRTLATITFQNYFRLYDKLSGMTGTASTSAEEFAKVYELDVVEIPTHRDMQRKDFPDVVYKNEEGKYRAIAKRVAEITKTGQPILIGTIAIEKSEYLSALLTREGIEHRVLNAKQHEKEALIINQAGQKGNVTIATNMAGRGTDIKLGEGVKDLGGLFIIGTERHEARRIDNQLRGRAGRQGDPGASQFYVSLEDELMRRFGGERMQGMMTKLGLPDDEPIQNGMVSKTIESAQSKIEGYNFDMRKHVLEYDDVMNKQREVVYRKRKAVLRAESFRDETLKLLSEEFDHVIGFHCAGEDSLWQVEDIVGEVNALAPVIDEKKALTKLTSIRDDRSKDETEKRSLILEYLIGEMKVVHAEKEKLFSKESWDGIQRALYLRSLDTLWMNHLDEIDYLRQGIGLRGIAQKDPLIEYKREAFDMFLGLMDAVRKTFLSTILKIEPSAKVAPEEKRTLTFTGASDDIEQFSGKTESSGGKSAAQPITLHNNELIGRNDPCPCGSGKKYKKCHMNNPTRLA